MRHRGCLYRWVQQATAPDTRAGACAAAARCELRERAWTCWVLTERAHCVCLRRWAPGGSALQRARLPRPLAGTRSLALPRRVARRPFADHSAGVHATPGACMRMGMPRAGRRAFRKRPSCRRPLCLRWWSAPTRSYIICAHVSQLLASATRAVSPPQPVCGHARRLGGACAAAAPHAAHTVQQQQGCRRARAGRAARCKAAHCTA